MIGLLSLPAFVSASVASEAAAPTYLMTIGFPGGAEMYPTGVAVAASGNVYVADDGNSKIKKYDASGNLITEWGGRGRGGNGLFDHARGVTVDSNQNVYVSDQGNGRIQKFDSNGTFLLKWGGLNQPREIATDRFDDVYVVHGSKVEKFSPSGVSLMQFGSFGSGDGQFNQPRGVAVDPAGNVFVTDAKNHRVQKFDPSGKFLLKFGTFGTGPGQFNYPGYVAVNAAGTQVYVVDRGGHRVQKFDGQGNFLMQWGTLGSGPGQFRGPRAVALDALGDVYVTDMWNYRVQKFDPSGNFHRLWGGGPPPDGGFNFPRGCAVNADGQIYTVEWWNQRVQKFAPLSGMVVPYDSIVLSDGPRGYWRLDESAGPTATDSSGSGIEGTYQGDVALGQPGLVPAYGGSAVSFGAMGGRIALPDSPVLNTTRAFQKTVEFWFKADIVAGGPRILYEQGGMQRGLSLYVHDGSLYYGVWGSEPAPWESFASSPIEAGRVYHALLVYEDGIRVSAYRDGGLVAEDRTGIGELRAHADDVGIGAIAQATRFHTGPATNDQGFSGTIDEVAQYHEVALSDDRIRKRYEGESYGPGEFIAKWGIRGAAMNELNFPSGIGLNGAGEVYVADTENHRVMKYTSDGRFLKKIGRRGSADGQFQFPRGVAVDTGGNIFVVEGLSSNNTVNLNNRVQKFAPSGSFLLKWGGTGSDVGKFDSPQGIALDVQGNVYVADTYNRRVQVFDASGTFLRIIGTGQGTGDGEFLEPRAVAVDQTGNIYVADAKRHDVQMFSPEGTFVLKWGGLGTGNYQFNNPWGLCVDLEGNIYVSDTWNNRIQVYAPPGVAS